MIMHTPQVTLIVVGGDVVPGPMPRETLAYLLNLDIPVQFIHGNGERELLAMMQGIETGAIPEQFRESVRWTAREIQPEYESVLASWPLTLRLQIPGLGEALFCHATPHNDTDVFTRNTPEDRLLPIFAGQNAAVVVCGHTHMQFDRMIGETRVVNAGSVGMPYGEPGAYWLLLAPTPELRHTRYDLAQAAERIQNTAYPLASDFAAGNVLQPPSEVQAFEVFDRAALK